MNRDLRNLIVATIATHPTAGPEEIAQLVANDTPQSDMRTFYRDLLVGPARLIANQQRREKNPPRPKPEPQPAPTPSLSPKLAERRTWWQQQLASEIVVGAGMRKLLVDCTMEDLRLAVKECDAAIGRHEARMSLYVRLISQMTQRRVHRVRDLPEQHPDEIRSA